MNYDASIIIIAMYLCNIKTSISIVVSKNRMYDIYLKIWQFIVYVILKKYIFVMDFVEDVSCVETIISWKMLL